MSHLRVVRDEPPTKRRRGARPPPVLTVEQERAAKASIRGLARSHYGTLAGMAEALGLHPDSIRQAVGKCRRLSAEIEAINNRTHVAQHDAAAARQRALHQYLTTTLARTLTLGLTVANSAVIRSRV